MMLVATATKANTNTNAAHDRMISANCEMTSA
jgi:hypothetical protein